jgi:threonine/homoserine efflux transporter RhtA
VQIQPAIKAAVSFGAGVFITFSQSHSPEVGLYTLAAYGLIVGLSSAALAFGRKTEGALQELPMATLATLIGIFAFLAAQSGQGLLEAFLALTATWGLISGAFGL